MADFDYQLPPELIAQEPLADRSASRLLVLEPKNSSIAHHTFMDLPELLDPGDLLVINDSRVIPARLVGHRETGGEAEILLLRNLDGRRWQCLMRPSRKLRIGEQVMFEGKHGEASATATVIEKQDGGEGIVELDDVLSGHLDAYGQMPLPPYIHHRLDDDERYQTVYARESGSAAAPTAGLHFTPEVFQRLKERSIDVASVTLHVGLDTFRPVTVEYAEDHQIHQEWCSVPQGTAQAITKTQERGNRVVAVGTTAARTLESYGHQCDQYGAQSWSGMTEIYITPGFKWQVVDAMVTNFHLPRSTLLLMMSSFAGRNELFQAYEAAIEERYRFFSFGDAMLVFRKD
jgi:S-adenosylmethionine:tRNA ribosyltransferase-isomerase